MNSYQDIPKTKINGKRVYQTSRYPEIPLSEDDIYVTTTQGDRFDILAFQYYQDESLWWVISIANEFLPQNSLLPLEGVQLRIPSNVPGIISTFNRINS